MFCPEDGTQIDPRIDVERSTTDVQYPPCEECGTAWRYFGEEGHYGSDPDYHDTDAVLSVDNHS